MLSSYSDFIRYFALFTVACIFAAVKNVKYFFMAYNAIGGFPPQQLSFSRKNKAWRKRCVDFGDNHSLMHYHLTRKSVFSMKIIYDLRNEDEHLLVFMSFFSESSFAK